VRLAETRVKERDAGARLCSLPLGALAFAVIWIVFPAPAGRTRRAPDYVGAVTLAGALSALVRYTSLGGRTLA
jgi:hypothetical protein